MDKVDALIYLAQQGDETATVAKKVFKQSGKGSAKRLRLLATMVAHKTTVSIGATSDLLINGQETTWSELDQM